MSINKLNVKAPRVVDEESRLARGPVRMAIVLALSGLLLILCSTPLWWFGGALLSTAVALGWRIWRQPFDRLVNYLSTPRRIYTRTIVPAKMLIEGVYLILIFCIATVMMSKAALGDRPVSFDHVVHYFKAWQMHEYFLPQGRLVGWSHSWFAGYPVGYLYPIGTSLWINLVHVVFLGKLSFSQSYAIAFWLFHVFTGYASYRFGRIVGGPHVGLIAAIFALTDMASFRFGGWAYTVVYGVWPQSLSLVFALLALCRLPAIMEQRGLGDIGFFGLWMGLALITHPVHLIFLPLVFIVAAIASAYAAEVRAASAMMRLMISILLALLIASVWLLPFWDTREYTYPMGSWWDTTYEMGKSLLDLTTLPGTLGFVLAFGMLAILIMLRTRRFVLLFTALMAIFIPAVSNSTIIDEFHLPYLYESFSRVQFIRMSTMVKPFWFTLAAFLLVSVLKYTSRLADSNRILGEPTAQRAAEDGGVERRLGSDPKRSYLQTGILALILGFLLVPFVVAAAQAFWTRHVDKTLLVESQRPNREDRKRLIEWIKRELPEKGFYRIGLFTGDDHSLFDLPIKFNKPLYKRGFTPCSNFIYKMRSRNLEVLKAVNVRYAISEKELPEEDYELLQSFGKLKIYSFRHYTPQPYEIIKGSGKVTVEYFGDEEIRLNAAAGSSGILRLNVSHFPRWKAFHNGESLFILPTDLEQESETTGFMTVPLSAGRYRFVFERTLLDEIALPLSLFGLFLAGVLIFSDRSGRGYYWVRKPITLLTNLADRAAGPLFITLRKVLLIVGIIGVFIVGIVLAQWRPALDIRAISSVPIRRVLFDFLEELSRARVFFEYEEGTQRCKWQKGRFICRDKDGTLDIDNYVASHPVEVKRYDMVRCVRARPEEDATLRVQYANVPVGDALIGYYTIAYSGRLLNIRRPVEFSIAIDGLTVYKEETKKDAQLYWFNIPMDKTDFRTTRRVTFSVRARNERRRHFCYYAQMVAF